MTQNKQADLGDAFDTESAGSQQPTTEDLVQKARAALARIGSRGKSPTTALTTAPTTALTTAPSDSASAAALPSIRALMSRMGWPGSSQQGSATAAVTDPALGGDVGGMLGGSPGRFMGGGKALTTASPAPEPPAPQPGFWNRNNPLAWAAGLGVPASLLTAYILSRRNDDEEKEGNDKFTSDQMVKRAIHKVVHRRAARVIKAAQAVRTADGLKILSATMPITQNVLLKTAASRILSGTDPVAAIRKTFPRLSIKQASRLSKKALAYGIRANFMKKANDGMLGDEDEQAGVAPMAGGMPISIMQSFNGSPGDAMAFGNQMTGF